VATEKEPTVANVAELFALIKAERAERRDEIQRLEASMRVSLKNTEQTQLQINEAIGKLFHVADTILRNEALTKFAYGMIFVSLVGVVLLGWEYFRHDKDAGVRMHDYETRLSRLEGRVAENEGVRVRLSALERLVGVPPRGEK
jgi:hypothetical protein